MSAAWEWDAYHELYFSLRFGGGDGDMEALVTMMVDW